MSLLVDVQMVPNKILELVKARILANRAKARNNQQVAQLKGPTRPRVQRAKFGADSLTYRRPEPAATTNNIGFPVAGFWLGYGEDTRDFRIRAADFSEKNEVRIKRHEQFIPKQEIRKEEYNTTGPGTSGSTTYNRQFTNYFHKFDDILLYFPVARDTCLVVYAETGVQYSFSGQTTFSEQWSNVESSGVVESESVYIATGFSTLSNTASSALVNKYSNIRAFITWRDGIKEINPPGKFSGAIFRFVLRYDNSTVSTDVVEGTSATESFEFATYGTLYPQIVEPRRWPLGQWPSTTLSKLQETSYSVVTVENIGFTGVSYRSWDGVGGFYSVSLDGVEPREDWRSYDPFIYLGSVNSKGADILSGIQGPGSSYVLLNPGVVVPTDPKMRTRQKIWESFFQNVSVPKASLSVRGKFDPSGDVFIGYQYDILRPFFYKSDGQLPATFIKNPASFIAWPGDDKNGNFAFNACWDWGNPAYCRQQLLDLGFTPEDLTPTAPDPNAPE